MDASASSTTTQQQQRGTKRKRPDSAVEDPTIKLAGKLHHELKEVRKAAKKARAFETQRVVKKLKGVRKKTPTATNEISVLEAELEELKTLNPDTIACTALRTRLLKDRHISESAAAKAAIARELPAASTPAPKPNPNNSKVHARLLSARALGASVAQTVAGMRAVLLPPPDADAEARAAGDDDDDDGEEDEGVDEDEDEDEDEEDHREVEEEEADAAGWESGSVHSDDGGDDSDEEQDEDGDGWESGSVHSDAPPPVKKTATKSASTSATKTKSTPAPSTTKASTKAASQAKTTTSASQFLPSLAVGYIGGGSDSDVEDADADAGGGGRKNRRGQRARQAIWEKKYGRGANHKKKEAAAAAAERAEQKAKFEARQAKREAAAAGRVQDGGWAGRNAKSTGGAATPGSANAKTGTGAGEKGLHPSWAAKKALKEKMAMGGGGVAVPQGKKIVFSD